MLVCNSGPKQRGHKLGDEEDGDEKTGPVGDVGGVFLRVLGVRGVVGWVVEEISDHFQDEAETKGEYETNVYRVIHTE